MAHAPTRGFGRRQTPSAPPRAPAPAAAPELPVTSANDWQDRDEELEAWKRARRRQLPWRQIAWMASLCFGIASFVLPDSVNDNVEYLLWALAAASLYAGWRKGRQ